MAKFKWWNIATLAGNIVQYSDKAVTRVQGLAIKKSVKKQEICLLWDFLAKVCYITDIIVLIHESIGDCSIKIFWYIAAINSLHILVPHKFN